MYGVRKVETFRQGANSYQGQSLSHVLKVPERIFHSNVFASSVDSVLPHMNHSLYLAFSNPPI